MSRTGALGCRTSPLASKSVFLWSSTAAPRVAINGGAQRWLPIKPTRRKGFRVLTINRSQTDRRQLECTHNLVEHTYEAGGRKQFWFTPFDELMPEKRVAGEHVFAGDIWTRVNPDDEGRRLALADYLFDADRKSSVGAPSGQQNRQKLTVNHWRER